MNWNDKYYELCYTRRIHEFKKIDNYKRWQPRQAQQVYKTIDEFYLEELKISLEELLQLRETYKTFDILYSKYFNEQRVQLFENPEELLKWFEKQNKSCHYCQITQEQLDKIVKDRGKNLTLNKKTKRSKGTLEIERLDSSIGYSFDNCALACPFCNNAKSNLIHESEWRKFFVPAMKSYHKTLLAISI